MHNRIVAPHVSMVFIPPASVGVAVGAARMRACATAFLYGNGTRFSRRLTAYPYLRAVARRGRRLARPVNGLGPDRHRDLGGVIFIHLRDRDGVTQIAIHADADEATHKRAEQVRPEYVIAVEGPVAPRNADTVNPNLATGEVELVAERIWILNESRTPPFPM